MHHSTSRRTRRVSIELLESRIAPASLLVSTLKDSGAGSLRDAITTANNTPGPDTITLKAGVLRLESPLPDITDDLTLTGAGKAVIDGSGKFRILSITGAGTDVVLEGVKLTHGRTTDDGGALLINAPGGQITIKRSTLTGNVAALSQEDYAPTADVRGGAIAVLAGNVTIESSKLTGNQARNDYPDATAAGGAIFNLGSLTVTGKTVISGNSAVGAHANGGAIFSGGGHLVIDGVTISKNQARGVTGLAGYNGMNGEKGASATSPGEDGEPGQDGENGTSGERGGDAAGGALYNLGVLEIRKSTVTGNIASGGNGGAGGRGGKGGLGGAAGPAYVDDYGIRYVGRRGYGGIGGAGGNGGDGGNAAGGAIFNGDTGSVTISSTLISANAAKVGLGGKKGLGGAGGAGSFTGSKGSNGVDGLMGSTAAGGGIFNAGTVQIDEKSAVTKNSVLGGDATGGGIHNTKTLSVEDSIVFGNTVKAANGLAGLAGLKGMNGVPGARGEDGEPGQDGGDGEDGENGAAGQAGANGQNGRLAKGGGVYNAGELTMRQSTVSGNVVISGNGGNGGAGGAGGNGGAGGAGGRGGHSYRSYDGYLYPAGHSGMRGTAGLGGNGGNGGAGGIAGDAAGGGIFSGDNPAAKATVQNSTISGNSAKAGVSGKGGAAGKAGSGRRDDFDGGSNGMPGEAAERNPAEGGGIFSSQSTLELLQVTVAKNIAFGSGGGVAVLENTATSIRNSTIAKNTAAESGGGLFAILNGDSDPVTVISSIIGANAARIGKDVSGTVQATFSLIQSSDEAITDPTDIIGKDPKLKALAFQGGTTQVMLPLPGSPALDAGSNPDNLPTDQRGSPRTAGKQIDIGAVEVEVKAG